MKQSTLFGVIRSSNTNKKAESDSEASLSNGVSCSEHVEKQFVREPQRDLGVLKQAVTPLQSKLIESNSKDLSRKTRVTQAQESEKDATVLTRSNPVKQKKKSLSLSNQKRASNVQKPADSDYEVDSRDETYDKVAKQILTNLEDVSATDIPMKNESRNKVLTQPISICQTIANEVTEEEKQMKNSIGYEDFLAQLSSHSVMVETNDHACQKKHDEQKNSSCADQTFETQEGNTDDKKTMSYSEFLGMFKSPVEKEDSQASDEKDEVDGKTDDEESSKTVKCKSITSYFAKTVCKTLPDNKKKIASTSSSKVTVVAEVHSHSLSKKKREMQEPLKVKNKIQKGNAAENSSSDEDTIILLSSETITDEDTTKKSKSLSIKKRKIKDNAETKGQSKKQKMENDINDRERQQPKILSDSEQSDLLALSRSPVSITTIATTVKNKNSQATLSFGKTGLSLTKAEKKVCDPLNASSRDSMEGLEDFDSQFGKTQPKRTKKTGKGDVTKTDKKELHDSEMIDSSPASTKRGTSNKREDRSLKELAASSESPAPFKTKDTTSVDTNANSEEKAVETPLRRSTRITRSTQPQREVEVMEIESDDEETVKNEILKRKTGKKDTASSVQSGKDSSAQKISKKPTGKIAPIFILGKPKEEEVKKKQPEEDPEKVRQRREFLMSGIPEELKRQIVSTSNTTVVLDYPAFPKISHVQQLTDSVEQPCGVKIFREYQGSDELDQKINLNWNQLGWNATTAYDMPAKNLFQEFKSHPALSESLVNVLINEICSSNRKFPFREIYNKMKSKIDNIIKSQDMTEPEVKSNNPSDEVVIVVDDTSPVSQRLEIKSALDPKACLWPDLHQPDSSDQIIGNYKVLKRLKGWLEDWKAIMQKEARKANRASRSSNKGKGKGSCWSDDSDFTDSEEEELRLCNTVLITGPHGVGKTSSVYALAQELGYKVFEVNSSTLRSGKQLLAQLEEATQSHRVAQNKSKCDPSFLGTPPSGTTRTEKSATEASSKKSKSAVTPVASAFANLFKTPASGAKPPNNKTAKGLLCGEAKKSASKAGRLENNLHVENIDIGKGNKAKKMKNKEKTPQDSKGKGGKESEHPPGGDALALSGSLNLASASLILVDEIDVVFEEDKGFLATVQHFMTSTKIPIILTSTDASFYMRLSSRHDHVVFKPPPSISATNFLSTVCLVHGVRVCPESISRVLAFMKGDIRRCLLYLQFWCESGGGLDQTASPISTKPQPLSSNTARIESLKRVDNKGNDCPVKNNFSRIIQSDDSSDSDFICLRPSAKRPKRIVCDDDSNSSSSFTSTVCDSFDQPCDGSENKDLKGKPMSLKRKREDGSESNSTKNATDVMIVDDRSTLPVTSLPLLHVGCEKSLNGSHLNQVSSKSIMDFIKAPSISSTALHEFILDCHGLAQTLGSDKFQQLSLLCVPLPKVDIPVVQLALPAGQVVSNSETASQKKGRKRIIQGDWFDSDGSDEEVKGKENGEAATVQEKELVTDNADPALFSTQNEKEPDTKANKGKNEEVSASQKASSELQDEREKSHTQINTFVLSEFAKYYENKSFVDSMESQLSLCSGVCGKNLIPGLSDDRHKHSKAASLSSDTWSWQISEAVNVLSVRKMCKRVDDIMKAWSPRIFQDNQDKSQELTLTRDHSEHVSGERVWPEELHLPVGKEVPDLWDVKMTERSIDTVPQSVCSSLGQGMRISDPALHTDYLPFLREICRSENDRRIAKVQRRFHHYLDNIGMNLKDSTVASLVSTYTVTFNNVP